MRYKTPTTKRVKIFFDVVLDYVCVENTDKEVWFESDFLKFEVQTTETLKRQKIIFATC